jgi:purine-binding chemotaxis protein CheW
MGITVDGVSDIQNLPKEKIQQTPEFTSREKTKYLRAVGKLKERLILILDLGKIIDLNEEKKLDELLLPLNEQDNRLVENG